jgi:hypothetical protein
MHTSKFRLKAYVVQSVKTCMPGIFTSQGVVGLLYAMCDTCAQLVQIPLHQGNDRPVMGFLDLEVMVWLDQVGLDPHFAATGCFCKTYNVKLDNSCGVHKYSYTFLCEHPLLYPHLILQYVLLGE